MVVNMNKYFIIGFICSVITFTTTIILANIMQITELNPIMNFFLNNTYYAIIYYAIIWAFLFTAFQYLKDNGETVYVNYLSYLVCFVFAFDLIHDLISIGGYIR